LRNYLEIRMVTPSSGLHWAVAEPESVTVAGKVGTSSTMTATNIKQPKALPTIRSDERNSRGD
jgi:hypothetical protein